MRWLPLMLWLSSSPARAQQFCSCADGGQINWFVQIGQAIDRIYIPGASRVAEWSDRAFAVVARCNALDQMARQAASFAQVCAQPVGFATPCPRGVQAFTRVHDLAVNERQQCLQLANEVDRAMAAYHVTLPNLDAIARSGRQMVDDIINRGVLGQVAFSSLSQSIWVQQQAFKESLRDAERTDRRRDAARQQQRVEDERVRQERQAEHYKRHR